MNQDDEKKDSLRRLMGDLSRNFECPLYEEPLPSEEAEIERLQPWLRRIREHCIDAKLKKSLQELEVSRQRIFKTKSEVLEEIADIVIEQKVEIGESDVERSARRIALCDPGVVLAVENALELKRDQTKLSRCNDGCMWMYVYQGQAFVDRLQGEILKHEGDIKGLEEDIQKKISHISSLPISGIIKRCRQLVEKLDENESSAKRGVKTLRDQYTTMKAFLNHGSSKAKAGARFEKHLMNKHMHVLCKAAGVDFKFFHSEKVDVKTIESCRQNNTPVIRFIPNIQVLVPKLKKGTPTGKFRPDGEIDGALVDITQTPLRVLKLFEFKLRPEDIPKADQQRCTIFSKLFHQGGYLKAKLDGKKVDIRQESLRNISPTDTMGIEEVSRKSFLVVTTEFRKDMSGLPSCVTTYALRMAMTSEKSLVLDYARKIRDILHSKGYKSPKDVQKENLSLVVL
ncbi:hypothetical protein AAMO2058_000221900 [Amorphochlora amoebiformis]